MKLGIVGCGYVSALYLRTIQKRTDLRIVGVTDLIRERSELLARHAGARVFDSMEDLIRHGNVDIIVNLTNPGSHYALNRAAIEANKHVYCEKPLATNFEDARSLVALAEMQKVYLSGAPCNVLSEVAQSVWRELRRGSIGIPRLVYAEIDDGMVHRSPYRQWFSEFGIPWPAKDEFEVGCTLEHAGYYLGWLATFFGPAVSVTRFGATTIPDKSTDEPLSVRSPDFTTACINFRSGVTARLTCSIVAEHDHRLRIFGDDGVLTVDDCWNYRSRATIRKRMTIRRRAMLTPWAQTIPLPKSPVGHLSRFGAATMDFAAGIAELSEAIRFSRPSRLSSQFCLHVNELALAIHRAEHEPGHYRVRTEFEPMLPMPWAR